MELEYPDRIAKTFAGKCILITGVTGFIGKVLLEKLLRSCKDIKKIYVLIRPKYNKASQERLELVFKSALFDLVKDQEGVEILQKVIAIQGDVRHEDLAMSTLDRKELINNINIVYHCAALLRFDESLKTSVLMNVRGTKLVLDLAKEMQHLELFCHTSSAYCHLYERIIYEKPYDPPADPINTIKVCENLPEVILSALTHKILNKHPNTYCFSKALSEGLINEQLNQMPVIILRPSLVIPAWKEPIPGWTDTVNGSIGFQIVAGKGILRTLYADVTRYPDLIPVDITVNAFLCAAFDYLRHEPGTAPRRIYNLTSSDKHKVSWYDIIYLGRAVITGSVPLNWVIWYPGGTIRSTRIAHNFAFFFQHILPAFIFDSALQLFNYQPILMPIFRRIQKGFDILKYYNGKQWDFSNEGSAKAREGLNPYERSKYDVYGDNFNYMEYFHDCTMCARRYILNEADETLPRARQHMKVMFYVDKVVMTLICFWIFTWIAHKVLD